MTEQKQNINKLFEKAKNKELTDAELSNYIIEQEIKDLKEREENE